MERVYSLEQKRLFNFFDELGIQYMTLHHQPLFTCADKPDFEFPAPETKNLFLKDDKKKLWLVSALQSTVIDLKKLRNLLQAPGLRFAQPELLKQYLGVEPGSVTWFALINDCGRCVHPILDKNILQHELTMFHPLKNDATTVIASSDALTFARALTYEPLLIDFNSF